ncbi:DMT family transporter [Chondromyces apiculatus]|uniref:Permease of the drug/metabolite transporter (DMT) superfamily n=1 Tax=Chondromyces apiculatus DSM 436 TaxID=1192034 RepID=A0A017T8A1_9BACT|nr:DMT family transporter [Chondromyces apiculatus]EYF05464.1 Permease of the drug/metabolite transporter (DMT) superfamily [Chondromyces apiculatus DSM 436]
MKTSRWIAYFECALAMAMGGGVVVAGKFLATTFPVFLAAGLRLIIAAPILTMMLLVREGRLPRLQAREACWLFACSFGGIFMFTVFLLLGLRYTTAAESGIITSTVPIFTTLVAVVFLKEKLGGWGVVAVLLTMIGILVLNVADGDFSSARGPDPWLGNGLIFGCVIGETLFTIAAKLASGRLSALAIAAYVNIFGLITFLPFAIYQALHFDFSAPGWTSWSAIVFMGVGISVFQFMIWFAGVSKVSGSTAAVFTGVMPVSAVLLSYAVGGERFIWPHLVGMVCIVASILAVTYSHASAREVEARGAA